MDRKIGDDALASSFKSSDSVQRNDRSFSKPCIRLVVFFTKGTILAPRKTLFRGKLRGKAHEETKEA